MMIRRWFLSPRKKRERSIALTAMSPFRFEILEQRTCMANDLDASPLRYMPPDVGANIQSIEHSVIAGSYSANVASATPFAVRYSLSGQRVEEVNCLIEPTYELYTSQIELCIDPSVGPRQLSGARLFSAVANAPASYAFLGPSTSYLGDALAYVFSDSLWSNSSTLDSLHSAGDSRPKLFDVPQTVVVDPDVEVKGEDPPSITTMDEDTDSPAILTARTSKHGDTAERQPAARKASFVAAIDWIHGSTTDELISFEAADSDEAITDQINVESIGQTTGQSKVMVKTAVSSDRYGWTALLASRASGRANLATTSNNDAVSRTVTDELRPVMAALPGIDAKSEVLSETSVHANQAETRHSEFVSPSTAVQPLPASFHQQLPVRTVSESSDTSMPEAMVTEAAALPLGVLITSEEKTESQPSSSSRFSRYWYLATIPAFLALPRRVRDRLPSIPRLMRI